MKIKTPTKSYGTRVLNYNDNFLICLKTDRSTVTSSSTDRSDSCSGLSTTTTQPTRHTSLFITPQTFSPCGCLRLFFLFSRFLSAFRCSFSTYSILQFTVHRFFIITVLCILPFLTLSSPHL